MRVLRKNYGGRTARGQIGLHPPKKRVHTLWPSRFTPSSHPEFTPFATIGAGIGKAPHFPPGLIAGCVVTAVPNVEQKIGGEAKTGFIGAQLPVPASATTSEIIFESNAPTNRAWR